MSERYWPAELENVQICFIQRSKVASDSDTYYYVILSTRDALNYLKRVLDEKELEEEC